MVDEQPRDIEPNIPEEGEKPVPSTKQMASSSMWAHHSLSILKNCRTAHMEPEVPDGSEETPEELLAKLEAADPYEPRLKPIDEDTRVTVSKSAKMSPWVVKLMGDSTEYKTEQGKNVSNGVAVVRSL